MLDLPFIMSSIPVTTPVRAYINAKRMGRFDFELYPKLWHAPRTVAYYKKRKWAHVFFNEKNKARVPVESGIYMFVVAPRHANLRDHTYIFYVGQTNNLQRRFKNYLEEMMGESIDEDRERIVDFLNYFQGYVFFNYTLVPESELDQAEGFLVDHLTPWANIRKKVKAQLATPKAI